MFDKILIANRGEIACRIMRSAQGMGIRCVAVYSEADADAAHVRHADEAIAIGPAASSMSYLVIERIVEATQRSGAQAVHPGYGFLAENADFAEALAAVGVVFIGPGARAIRAMGDKLESKRLATRAGVNTIPGFDGILEDADQAARVARDIGYPVMLKATAGGGGKGMRIARDEVGVREGFASATSESVSSFGDGRLLIEKYIEAPRHIEIQLLADSHGKCIHLGERECSIQRRHQKVIEEAPSPFIDASTRAAMGAQAIALADAVDYCSAGTVEFIADQNKNFYFLEMNTRLQVEHPVTELVTGIDIVEQMIRIAAGEKLEIEQDAVTIKGAAMEARIYAEDPSRGFLPAPGRIRRYRPPDHMAGVRIDSGVYEGAVVTLDYDPLIAKLCTWDETRAGAIARMAAALDEFELIGPGHNISFLASVMRRPRFIEGRLDTGFIEQEYGDSFTGDAVEGARLTALLTASVLIHLREQERANLISGRVARRGSGPEGGLEGDWSVSLDGAARMVTAAWREAGVEVVHDGLRLTLESDWRAGEPLLRGRLDGQQMTIQVARHGAGYRLRHGGVEVDVVVRRARAAELAARMPAKAPPDRSRFLLSPMPGRVISIAVAEGQEVKAGDVLCVVDAMKMENVLRAERDGRIARIVATQGDSLNVDQVILEFE
ncbi:MAG: acetyl/propionyl/methylcrotonyl-CoA carboxylase subunit alpha [Proteobacteria bacterium]|nr:acetyl/propionyl/methylcrotonyl-CoA carboxylase subunit alpha [Pseudomonadota bacterium]